MNSETRDSWPKGFPSGKRVDFNPIFEQTPMNNVTKRSRLPRSLRATDATAGSSMARAGLTLGISTVMLAPLAASAADPQQVMAPIKVEATAIEANPNAEPGVPYKAKYSGDERHTRPLAETPQNIAVLTKAQIEESGYTDLRDILDSQPGITLGTGENGNAFGDRYIIRGQEARSDVFVDGMRDPGMTIRESFAVEQVEISKGPNSSFAGRGTSGGAVNAVTKQASLEYGYAKVTGALGSDDYGRATLDVNQHFGERVAVRANALYAYEEIPDREPADRERKGLALSALFAATQDLQFVVDYYGLRAEDNPDLGGYLVGEVPNRRPARNVPVYAQEEDFLKSDVDTATARINYRFNSTTRLTNITRLGSADNGYVVTGARAATTNANNPGGVYETSILSTHQGWQEVDYLANQTNLFLDRTLGGMTHEFIVGLEYSDHAVLNGQYNIPGSGQNCAVGNNTAVASWCTTNPDGSLVSGLNTLMNRQISNRGWDIDWNVDTISAYLMDTVDLSERWTVFAGLRWDRFDFDTATQNLTTLARADYDYSDSLFNGHVGVTYDITENGLIYVSFATASDINGGESDVGTSCGYGGVCIDTNADVQIADSKPEKTHNFEVGTKWNLMGERLLVSAAVFQIDKTDVMEQAPNDPGYTSMGSQNTGENRVRGIEIGLSGNITDKLTAQAGATFMDAEVLESNVPTNEGKTLSNFADNTAFAQLRYQITDQLVIGGVAKYESEKFAGQPDTAAGLTASGAYAQPIPSYTVFDLFASYRFNPKLDLRLNVGNVADKEYYLAGYRSGSFLYKGDARNFRLALNYDF